MFGTGNLWHLYHGTIDLIVGGEIVAAREPAPMPTRLFFLQPPRHPLARLALTLLGLAVFGVLLVFGFFAFLALAAIGAVLMLVGAWRNRHRQQRPDAPDQPHDPDVIEGEYVIIHERRDRTHS